MLKSELRKIYLEKRKSLSEDEVRILSEKIFRNFILQFSNTDYQNIHCFLSIKKFNEIDTFPFINYFLQRKSKIFVPKVIGKKLISIELTENTEMENSNWGILEPKSNEDGTIKNYDIVITPLVYCDEKGNRIGYGKGFYDDFFSKINVNCLKIGVSFFPPNEIIEDTLGTDIPLDYLICPSEIFSFGNKVSNLRK